MSPREVSDNGLRLVAIGALAGLLAGVFIAIPATSVAHALVLLNYHPTAFETVKSTCCGQVLPGFWSQVLPDLSSGFLVVRTALGLMSGAALGAVYVTVRRLVPGPTALKAGVFAVALALPFDIFVPANFGTPGVVALALISPWESPFVFPGPLGTVPPYHLPLEFRLVLALPVVAGGLAMAGFVQLIESRLPGAWESRSLKAIFALLAVIAGIGLLALPLITGLVHVGGD